MPKNKNIIKILREMAVFWEMEGTPFRPQAYEKAVQGLLDRDLDEKNLASLYEKGGEKALLEIPGVGKGIAEHIVDFFKKGTFAEYEKFRKKYPFDAFELTKVEGIGPKMAKILWQKLKIKNLRDLEKAAGEGKIRKLENFGEKSEEKILRGLEFLKKSAGRQVLGFIRPFLLAFEEKIKNLPGVEKAALAGSARRRCETVGDIDIIVSSAEPAKVMAGFVSLSEVDKMMAGGDTKTSARLKNGLDADLRVVPQESYGAALLYFTGSKEHNIKLRELAAKKGWKLNEYGLYDGKKMLAGRAEKEIYEKLGLRFIEPEMRMDEGEIESARDGKLPNLIAYGDLRGDLQTQTDWTDGEDSMEDMTRAAAGAGLEYILITDHTRSLAMMGGADEKKLRRQMKEIDKLNSKLKSDNLKIKVLKGAEVNIKKDGSLDIADEVLAKLDIVGAAAHSHFNLSRKEQTERMIKAMGNPNVDIIFHLSGRVLNRRDAMDLDFEEILKAAKKTRTVLEIDAFPDRLDIKHDYIRRCVEEGVKMSISSDAHSVKHFSYLECGLAEARRGGAEKKDIINAWPLTKMLGFLK